MAVKELAVLRAMATGVGKAVALGRVGVATATEQDAGDAVVGNL